jgi:predicted metal-binding protein
MNSNNKHTLFQCEKCHIEWEDDPKCQKCQRNGKKVKVNSRAIADSTKTTINTKTQSSSNNNKIESRQNTSQDCEIN